MLGRPTKTESIPAPNSIGGNSGDSSSIPDDDLNSTRARSFQPPRYSFSFLTLVPAHTTDEIGKHEQQHR